MVQFPLSVLAAQSMSWSRVTEYSEYKYAVEGSTDFNFDCPLATNCTKTFEGAEVVIKRFEAQGLNVIVRSMREMRGLNPYYEVAL